MKPAGAQIAGTSQVADAVIEKLEAGHMQG
jgi:hypothetical protein